jgi:hypothetical protein
MGYVLSQRVQKIRTAFRDAAERKLLFIFHFESESLHRVWIARSRQKNAAKQWKFQWGIMSTSEKPQSSLLMRTIEKQTSGLTTNAASSSTMLMSE